MNLIGGVIAKVKFPYCVSADCITFLLGLTGDSQCWMLSEGLIHYAMSGLLGENAVFNFLGSLQLSLVCTLLWVQCLLPVSVYQWDKSIPPLWHHHSSFPSVPSPNCKHSLTSCLGLWSLTPVACGSCSPTDVSVPQSPPGCFLAERRQPQRVSSGDRARPDPGHSPGGWIAHSAGKISADCWAFIQHICQLFACQL